MARPGSSAPCSDQRMLPGFRFHPTEEELLGFYLAQAVHGVKPKFEIIGDLNIYLHDPWELPKKAKGEREWYFLVPRDRKGRSCGGRPNRTTKRGFWKATGSDKAVRCASKPKIVIGYKKTLVYYQGRAPTGTKTDWVMNEYRLPEDNSSSAAYKKNIVLCKIYRKATSLKELEIRAATGEEAQRTTLAKPSEADKQMLMMDALSSTGHENFQQSSSFPSDNADEEVKTLDPKQDLEEDVISATMQQTLMPPELQIPSFIWDSLQEPYLWPQGCSPWQDHLDQWSPLANLLNF